MMERWIYVACACFGLVAIVGLSSPSDPDPAFVVEPVSVNASLSNEVVEFICSCIYCTGQFWVVDDEWALNDVNDGRGINVDDLKILTDGSYLYRLTMPPLEVNDNTEIYCVIHNTTANKVVTSQLVVLRVQGLLGEVDNLTVTNINSTTLLVSFEEPFSLLGVPILFYTIAVITVDTMDIVTITNSTKTSIYLHLDNVCSQHELIMSAWNEVGEGQTSKALALLYDVPTTLNPDLITNDMRYQESKLEVALQFEVNESCTGRITESVMLNISSTEGSQLIMCPLPKSSQDAQNCPFTMIISKTDTSLNPLVHIVLSQILQTNHHYHVSVVLSNQVGSTPATEVPISTYDIQRGDAVVSVVGSVCVTCNILAGSPMKICMAIFVEISTERRIEVVIPGPTFSDCVELPPGEYNVELKDTSMSGDAEMGVAYHIQTTIKVKQTSPAVPITTSPAAVATQSNQSNTVSIFPVALGTAGIVIGLLVIVMIMLVVCLHHFQTKARKLAKEKEEEKSHHSYSADHPLVEVQEFGNIASEPKHVYDNIHELSLYRRTTTIPIHASNPMPPSAICMQHCPAYEQPPPNVTT